MGVIAWIVLGVIAGTIAEHFVNGRQSAQPAPPSPG